MQLECRFERAVRDAAPPSAVHESEKESKDSNFVIIRRRIETLDDVSLSSNESDDDEMNQDLDNLDTRKPDLESSNDPLSTSGVVGISTKSPNAAIDT